jgi:hypothetical protein
MFAASKTSAAAAGAPPASTDPQFNYVTLLLNDTGTNGQQNNTFLDSSTNNFTITRNGTPTQGSVTPYWPDGQWSNYFSSTGQYLTTPSNAALSVGTGNFTYECFVYINALNGLRGIAGQLTSTDTSGNNSINFYTNGSALNVVIQNNSVAAFQVSTTVVTGQWYHVVMVRSGTTVSAYVNGTRIGTATNSTDIVKTSFVVGRVYTNDNNYYGDNYVSNLRLVKGTAVYDPTLTTLTVPTTPLTAVSGTSLLTCQSNRFKDNSSNNFAITVTGTPTVQAFEPFEPASSYGVSNGGSGYFNGTTDYLSLPSDTAFTFGTGDFTFEAWVFHRAASSLEVYMDQNTNGFSFSRSSANKIQLAQAGVAVLLTSNSSLTINQWNHIAVTRSGTTGRIFINGVLDATATVSTNFSITTTSTISRLFSSGANYLNGYITNLRMVKGTAVYTANFTPPTSPVTAITNTSLLLNFTNAGIYDAAVQNDLVTVGNAQVSTAVAKFGSSSMAFDGSGDWLTAPANALFNFGTGNFTVETWVYITSNSPAEQFLYGKRANNAAYAPLLVGVSKSGTVYRSYYVGSFTGASWGLNSSFAKGTIDIPLNTWVHLAVVRNGSTFTSYVNGVADLTFTGLSSALMTNTDGVTIGADATSGSAPLFGYLDDVRITKGYARYTANFTPPTAPFPTR